MAIVAMGAIATACGRDAAFGPNAAPARLRVVNAVFIAGNPADTAPGLTGSRFRTATAVSIDVLVDSGSGAPSVLGLAPNSVSTGTSSASPVAGAAGYTDAEVGVRSFVARYAASVDPGTPARLRTTSFYTNPSDTLPYLPRQALTPGTPYTLIAAGQLPGPVLPAGGAAATPAKMPSTSVPFVLLVDDPFTPPTVTGGLQARFRVVNAAPYVTNPAAPSAAALAVYLTPQGSAAPTGGTGGTLATFTPAATPAAFRGASGYANVAPGAYTLSLAAGTTIVFQGPLTLEAGDVRSLVFLDDFTTPPSQLTPCAANGACSFRVANLLDAKF